MEPYDVIRNIPLATGCIWIGCLVFQVSRRRYRTWTDRFFISGITFLSLYVLNDWLFLNVSIGPSPAEAATVLAELAMSYLTLGTLFLLLFMKAFHGKVTRRDLQFLVPSGTMLLMCWDGLVQGVSPAPWGWQTVFNRNLFGLWVIYGLGYMGSGVFYIHRIAKALSMENPGLGRKTSRVTLLFVALIFMGALTNTMFELMGLVVIPLFSSLLAIPGAALLLILSPFTRDRINLFIRGWKARAYEVQQAFLVYENGTLIASQSKDLNSPVDRDIFAATLDAIQTFMRTSFPLLRGKWLKTIEHGANKIILERGQHVYLAVVIQGDENDQLRTMMKDVISAVEVQNAATLLNWGGLSEAIVGAKEAMGALLRGVDSGEARPNH